MEKATDALLKDHKMIRKTLEDFRLDNPRFGHLLKTLHRIVVAHAWFEDEIFLPALEAEPSLRRLNEEIGQEHKDIHYFLKTLKTTPSFDQNERESAFLQLVTLLKTHFEKEEDALFPLAERILEEEGLINLGEEMKRRRMDVRGLVTE